jgi:hypothetical protein
MDEIFRENLAEFVESKLGGCTELIEKIDEMNENKENEIEKPDCAASSMLG